MIWIDCVFLQAIGYAIYPTDPPLEPRVITTWNGKPVVA